MLTLLLAMLLGTPDEFTFRPARDYDPEVPTPQAFLGYEIGTRFTPHQRILEYCEAIAQKSARTKLKVYGKTYEGRSLVLMVISSPANVARFDELSARIRSLADPRLTKTEEEARVAAATLPVLVWLSYNVHGNEPSSSEAALPALYHFAAARDPESDAILQNAVIILDPCLNPDGRERYVSWFQSVCGPEPNPDPIAAEHHEPWPGGRVNHYYFDLNRDWAFLTQAETQGRVREYLEHPPQVHVDFHEMGPESTYFFFPAAVPLNTNYPRSTVEWARVFGESNAHAFDRFGWAYYTAEFFDLFYPGYGDSWPSFRGAIGMTYEQAGHSAGGLAYLRRDGALLTLRDRVAHHFTSSLATVKAAADNRVALLADFHRFHEQALWEAEHGPIREFLLPPSEDPALARELVELLERQGIEVQVARTAFQVEHARSFDGREEPRTFPDGTYILDLRQPQKRLLKGLLEPNAAVQDISFYDISAWSLPLSFGLECFMTSSASAVDRVPLAQAEPPSGGIAAAPGRAVLYGVAAGTARPPELLCRVLEAELPVHVAREPFAFPSLSFPRGSFVIPAAKLTEAQVKELDHIAKVQRALVLPLPSYLTSEGIDLGSDRVDAIKLPVIAILTGESFDPGSVGAVRFYLEQRLHLKPTMLLGEDLGSADLTRYNVLVFPSGSAAQVAGRNTEVLQRFAARGGVVIALGSSSFAFTKEGGKLTEATFLAAKEKDEKEDDAGDGPMPIAERRRKSRLQNVPGTLFKALLDPDHPLSVGLPAQLPVLLSSTRAFRADKGGTPIAVLASEPWLSGYVSKENVQKIAGKAYAIDVSHGRGHFVLFADDPTFRLMLQGSLRLFANAVLLYSVP